MPVEQFGNVGVVVDVHDRPLAFLESQQGSGKLPVVERGRDDMLGSQFGQSGRDPQGVVRSVLLRAQRKTWSCPVNGSSAPAASRERRSIGTFLSRNI
jgi:hypothetical protein